MPAKYPFKGQTSMNINHQHQYHLLESSAALFKGLAFRLTVLHCQGVRSAIFQSRSVLRFCLPKECMPLSTGSVKHVIELPVLAPAT